MPELSFNRLQLSDEECSGLLRRNFGRFVAREAVLDEELWVGILCLIRVTYVGYIEKADLISGISESFV